MAAYLVELLLEDDNATKERYTTMETSNIVDFASRDGISDALTDLLRTGARQLIVSAVEADLEGFVAQFARARQRATRRSFATATTLHALFKRALAR